MYTYKGRHISRKKNKTGACNTVMGCGPLRPEGTNMDTQRAETGVAVLGKG